MPVLITSHSTAYDFIKRKKKKKSLECHRGIVIHELTAAISSSSPSVAVPGPHVSCGTGVPALHPWAALRPVWINPSAALLAPGLGGRKSQSPPWPRGGTCWWGAGSWMGFGNRVSLLSLSLCRFLSSCCHLSPAGSGRA